jgi:hypothetical protein
MVTRNRECMGIRPNKTLGREQPSSATSGEPQIANTGAVMEVRNDKTMTTRKALSNIKVPSDTLPSVMTRDHKAATEITNQLGELAKSPDTDSHGANVKLGVTTTSKILRREVAMVLTFVRLAVALAFLVLIPAWLLALTLAPISLGIGIAIAHDATLARDGLELLRATLTPPDE